MGPKQRRKFNVLDALVLIAAVGVGLAWMRGFTQTRLGINSYPGTVYINGRPSPTLVRAVLIGFWWVDAFYNLVAVVTIALCWRRTSPPRPDFRRLTRQPGAVACLAVTAAISVEMISKVPNVVSEYLRWWPRLDVWNGANWIVQGPFESLAVFVAWLLLMGSGRWKPEKSWVDHFGLILGVFWLVFPPLEWLIRNIMIDLIWRYW